MYYTNTGILNRFIVVSEKEYIKVIDSENRVRVYRRVEKGQVKHFVVQYEALISGKWYAIIRYNSAHGFAHRDIIHPDGKVDKHPLPFSDFAAALTYGEQDISEHWKQYRERFEKEMGRDALK